MKYLSILSVLLLIGGNFSFATEGWDSCQQQKKMTMQEKKFKRIKANRNVMEEQKSNYEESNVTRQKVREMRNGLRHRQEEQPMVETSWTINVDGEITEL